MKIIDLLNKIANGEEVPKKIKYCGVYYYWTGFNYENSEADDVLFWAYIYSEKHLNDDIEIIEEDKKIEKFKDYIPIGLTRMGADFRKEDVFDSLMKIGDKINEIIDKLNKEE